MHSIVGLVGVCSAIAVRTSLARQPLSRSEQLSLKLPDNLKVQFKRQHIRSDTKLTSSCKLNSHPDAHSKASVLYCISFRLLSQVRKQTGQR
ncbi:hypothetical protein Gasu2_61500 [Galdieria sulphuraria]|nr:hypothetical protein Gasu2_61500 [Galdieria sulphuraria]